jgi:Zn-dependent protease
VSTITPQLRTKCRRCGRDLALGALVCENCQALVHSEDLDRLSDAAKVSEAKGQLREARDLWLQGLPLLPPNSRQSAWILQHARELEASASTVPAIANPDAPASVDAHPWARRLGPLAPIAVLLAKGKFLFTALFKLKFLFSFIAFFSLYWAMWGPRFGIGFAVLILIHEMGHYIDVRRRGLPAEMPVFLPGLGAYVKWQGLGVSRETRAAVALAGPFAGFLSSLACAVIWWQTANPLWGALAHIGAVLNLLNLIPVWVLDGSQAAGALSKMQRILLVVMCAGLWLVTGEGLLLLVALGFCYQIFLAGDFPAHPSSKTTLYFASVLSLLALLLRVLPAQSFAGR